MGPIHHDKQFKDGVDTAKPVDEPRTSTPPASMPDVASRPLPSDLLGAAPAGTAAATTTQPLFGSIQKAFFSAVRKGDIASVKQFLENGAADLEATDPADGNTALFTAAHAGYAEVVSVLLKAGSDASTSGKSGGYQVEMLKIALQKNNALVIACLLRAGADIPDAAGDRMLARLASDPDLLPLAQALLEAKSLSGDAAVDINAVNGFGRSALVHAVENGNVPMVRLLLQHGADATSGNAFGASNLVMALRSGNTKMLQLLIAHGADVPDAQGRHILAAVVRQGYLAWVKHLIKGGATLNAEDRNGNSALTEAIFNGKTGAAKMLLQAGARLPLVPDLQAAVMTRAGVLGDVELLALLAKAKMASDQLCSTFDAARSGDLEQMQALIAASSCDLALRDPATGKTVLIIAAEAGHIEVVRVLLRHGMATASVSAQARNQRADHGVYQRQQLDHALANKDMPVLRSLLQADADTPDANGDRLLMRTVKRADIGAVTVLVEAIRQASIGASTWVDEANDQGETALMRATAAGNAGMVRLLLAAGADVTLDNAQDVLLGLALDARDLDTIRLLLAAGADVPDPGGDYALMQAISLNNADWVDLLLQAGASMQGGNWTPLELAVVLNRTEMVRMLLAAGVPLPDAEAARVSLLESARRFGNNDMEQLLLAAKKDGTS